MLLELCKFFKNEKHRVQVTFNLYTELGHCWVIAITAFFLIRGYFSTHQVVFRPWGLQNTKNAFYKKMLCDQASDEIILKSLPTTCHLPLVIFYIILRGLSIPRAQPPCPLLPTASGSATLPSPANLYRAAGARTYKINSVVSGAVVDLPSRM